MVRRRLEPKKRRGPPWSLDPRWPEWCWPVLAHLRAVGPQTWGALNDWAEAHHVASDELLKHRVAFLERQRLVVTTLDGRVAAVGSGAPTRMGIFNGGEQ